MFIHRAYPMRHFILPGIQWLTSHPFLKGIFKDSSFQSHPSAQSAIQLPFTHSDTLARTKMSPTMCLNIKGTFF
jgi:hypothetical protein